MKNTELKSILEAHHKWLDGEPDGCRANLSGADLSGRDLSGCILSFSDLSNCDLSGCKLIGSYLGNCNLSHSYMVDCILQWSNLHGSDMSGSDLTNSDLRGANLCDVNLRGAKLCDAKNVDKVIWNATTEFYPLQCPEEGAFIGWKKVHNRIVKLEICADALRSSATSRKCRCSSAKVLAIENIDGSEYRNLVRSDYDPYFTYKVGEIVKVENFDTNRWNECAPGIHFFITREEAVKYS